MEERILLADLWINADSECLVSWQCWMQTYKVLWIRWWESANPSSFVADIFLWATMFIWVIVTISLVISWIMLIFAAWDEKYAERWKSWVKYSIIWLLLVIFSYSIIRWIQLISWW